MQAACFADLHKIRFRQFFGYNKGYNFVQSALALSAMLIQREHEAESRA